MYKLIQLKINNVVVLTPQDLIFKEDYSKMKPLEKQMFVNNGLSQNDFAWSANQRKEMIDADLVVFIDYETLEDVKVIKVGVLKKKELYDTHKGKDAFNAQILTGEKKAKSIAAKDLSKE